MKHHPGLAKLIRNGNEHAEMLELTVQMGRYVDEEVEKLQVSHVNKRQRPDATMGEAEGGAQAEETTANTETNEETAAVVLNENQRQQLLTSAKAMIATVFTNAVEGGSGLQQHFKTADESHTKVPQDNDPDIALNMVQEDMMDTTKTERVKIMMQEVLETMIGGQVILTWKEALASLHCPSNMSDIQIPSAIKALVAEDLREIYEHANVMVPTVEEREHELPGGGKIVVEDRGSDMDMEEELQQFE